MNMQTKVATKTVGELNQTYFEEFVWARNNKNKLRYKTQDWSCFDTYTESYCRYGMELFYRVYRRLCVHIEQLVNKGVLNITDDNVVNFDDGSSMKIIYKEVK